MKYKVQPSLFQITSLIIKSYTPHLLCIHVFLFFYMESEHDTNSEAYVKLENESSKHAIAGNVPMIAKTKKGDKKFP